MASQRYLGLVMSALVALAACEDEPRPPPPPASPEMEKLAQSICDLSFRCCARGELNYYLGPFIGEDDCVSRLVQQARLNPAVLVNFSLLAGLSDAALLLPNLGALDEAVADRRITVDEPALAACRQFLGEHSCNVPQEEEPDEFCALPEPPPEETPCDIDKLFIGLIPAGDPCTSDTFSLECEPGLKCLTGAGLGVEGRCVQPTAEGGKCFFDGECAEDLYCSLLDGVCTSPRPAGETCVFSDRNAPSPSPETLLVRCEPGLSCDPISDTCVAPCQPGAACVIDEQCDEEQELSCITGRCSQPRKLGLPCGTSEDCEEGLLCGQDPQDPSRFTCQQRLAVGAICNSHLECSTDFCDPTAGVCAAQLPNGDICPTGLNQQCDMGTCVPENPLTFCTGAIDCPITGVCSLATSRCASYCVGLLPDGAQCTFDSECASTACAAGFCRTLPLGLGVGCDVDFECDSEFCSLDDERACKELPLGLGERCGSSEHCDSGVCFSPDFSVPPTCTNGLDEGEACGDSGLEPCNPKRLYCETDEEPVVCVELKETGETCESSFQCRGECLPKFGRLMCSPAAPDDRAICDGGDAEP